MINRASAKHIYFFVGTTAELIKVMPVIEQLKEKHISFKLISSGQNNLNLTELESVFGKISVDIVFGQKKGNHKVSTKNFINWSVHTLFHASLGLRKEFEGLKKDQAYLIVHGDTVSSAIGAIIGKLYGLTVVHIESGLRSFDYLEPFPEEICRHLVSILSDVHFCPNSWSVRNLKHTSGKKINTKKNIVIESLFKALSVTPKSDMPKSLQKNRYFMFMMHRQEHMLFHKDKNKKIIETVLSEIPKGMKCVVILHSLTEAFLEKQQMLSQIKNDPRVITIPRQPYTIFSRIMSECEFMITDGGSTQEEAYYLGKPCLIIRNKTERIEGLKENAVMAKGNLAVIKNFIKNYKSYKRKKVKLLPKPSAVVVNYFS